MSNNINWLFSMKIAHRGYHSAETAPENSIKAFENAIKEGFAIELDIHILKDNNIVVFHDDSIERMTGYNKNIEDCTFNEIKEIKLLGTEEKIPLFSDVLALVKGKVPLMIELKNSGKARSLEQHTYELLKKYSGDYVIQSFNPFSLGWFKKNAPQIIRGQLSGSFKDVDLQFYKKFLLRNLLLNKISKPHFINYEIEYLSSLAVKIQKLKGIPILGWTARNEKTYKAAIKQCENVVFEGFNIKNIK